MVATIGLVAAANLAILVYLRRTDADRIPDRLWSVLMHGPVILDLAGLTVWLHFGGGAENPFFPFFAFPVILAAVLMSRRIALVYAAAASLLYCGLLAGERLGWFPHYPLAGFGNPEMYQRTGPLVAPGTLLDRHLPGGSRRHCRVGRQLARPRPELHGQPAPRRSAHIRNACPQRAIGHRQ